MPVALRGPASSSAPARARAARRRSARPRVDRRVLRRRRRRACRRACRRARARRRARSRSSANAQPASFSPNVVGSAWTPCVRPMQSVSRCSSARATTASKRAVEPVEDRAAPASCTVQRERGVEHVGRGQPVVEPAAVLAERLGDRVDERGDVVVRLALDLGDARRRRRAAPRADRGRRRRPGRRRARPAVERRQLDLEPRASFASSDQIARHRGAGVAGDHAVILGRTRRPRS